MVPGEWGIGLREVVREKEIESWGFIFITI
jgi:hypothetical protein